MMRGRIADEATIASRYGTGTMAFIKGAMFEFSRKGMWNRVLLVFCAFALQNMSGAAGAFFSLELPAKVKLAVAHN